MPFGLKFFVVGMCSNFFAQSDCCILSISIIGFKWKINHLSNRENIRSVNFNHGIIDKVASLFKNQSPLESSGYS